VTALTGAVLACSPRPPVFNPLSVTATPGLRDVVVQVRPIDTRLGSEDRRQYGVDIGAYFSAFLVSVENRTMHDLAVDLKSSTLGEPSGSVSEVLSDDDLVRTYRRGGMDEKAVELVAKAPRSSNATGAASRSTNARHAAGDRRSRKACCTSDRRPWPSVLRPS
jgi:hypothetical protein